MVLPCHNSLLSSEPRSCLHYMQKPDEQKTSQNNRAERLVDIGGAQASTSEAGQYLDEATTVPPGR